MKFLLKVFMFSSIVFLTGCQSGATKGAGESVANTGVVDIVKGGDVKGLKTYLAKGGGCEC